MTNADSYENEEWEIHTHDVDQADSHSLITSQETRVMIDADEDQIVDALDHRIFDHFVATHHHKDHIAGLRHLRDAGCSFQEVHPSSADRYEVDVDGGVKSDLMSEYLKCLSSWDIDIDDIDYLTTGDKILNEDGASLRALSPPPTSDVVETTGQSTGYPRKFKPEKANANGAVCKFEGPNDVSGLFMGDAGDESAHNAESWLVEQHDNPDSEIDLNADILYVGHHGSKYATNEEFLNRVDPDHIVISSGLDNDYTSANQYDGHPHDEVLKRVHEYNETIDVSWTGIHGTTSTIVENGVVQIAHDNELAANSAADIAAMKYYTRANDFDQDQFADIEQIISDDLPAETPEWTYEADIVNTNTSKTVDYGAEQSTKPDEARPGFYASTGMDPSDANTDTKSDVYNDTSATMARSATNREGFVDSLDTDRFDSESRSVSKTEYPDGEGGSQPDQDNQTPDGDQHLDEDEIDSYSFDRRQ